MIDNAANWILREESFEPNQIHHKETIFTSGNGYLSTRGTFEEGYPGARPATFAHGVFDEVPIFFTELANLPDWTGLDISLAGERFSLAVGEILGYERCLDLRNGLLTRQVRWRSPSGFTANLTFERFASLADPHLACLRVAITPLDFSEEVSVRASLNGGTDTQGVIHWNWLGQNTSLTSSWLCSRTISSGIDLGIAMRLAGRANAGVRQEGWDVKNNPTLVAAWQGQPGKTFTVEKTVVIYTSRDVDDPIQAANDKLAGIPDPGWETLLAANEAAWQSEWQACDVVIEGDEDAQLAVRFNLFQLLIAAPRQDERVSIGAKTLSGFGYRGHAFWDTEIFMLPFFTFTRPEIARNLLSYRWHTLAGARRKAEANQYSGAQFAWESASSGDEVAPTWLPHFIDPKVLVRIWTGDIEIHVSADIAYAIDQYWRVTGDDAFLLERGLEIILETAKFWGSRAEWDEQRQIFHFRNVIGPDEYHDHVDNNAYTNYLARWHLLKASELLDWTETHYPEIAAGLSARLDISSDERKRWPEVAAEISLPVDSSNSLIEQFEGYFQREDVDLQRYANRSRSMQSLLGIEGVNETQVIKQPDVLMLQYLLPDWFNRDSLEKNYKYYNSRTDHSFGSSLGPAIHAIMACRLGRSEEAYEHFTRAVFADINDLRGNCGDGIHGASAGGVWQALIFGFGGLRLSGDTWSVEPVLPRHWRCLAFKFFFRGEVQEVVIRKEA